jgi:hypothetical protein
MDRPPGRRARLATSIQPECAPLGIERRARKQAQQIVRIRFYFQRRNEFQGGSKVLDRFAWQAADHTHADIQPTLLGTFDRSAKAVQILPFPFEIRIAD